MARNNNLPDGLVEDFTVSSHYGSLEAIGNTSAIKHGFVALVPHGTDLNDPMVALELCPTGQLIAPRENGRFISYGYLDGWDQFFFSVPGDPLEQLREMTLPAGSEALAFSGLVKVARPQKSDLGKDSAPASEQEIIDAYLTVSVARQGREITLITPRGESTVLPVHTASPVSVAMREVLLRTMS